MCAASGSHTAALAGERLHRNRLQSRHSGKQRSVRSRSTSRQPSGKNISGRHRSRSQSYGKPHRQASHPAPWGQSSSGHSEHLSAVEQHDVARRPSWVATSVSNVRKPDDAEYVRQWPGAVRIPVHAGPFAVGAAPQPSQPAGRASTVTVHVQEGQQYRALIRILRQACIQVQIDEVLPEASPEDQQHRYVLLRPPDAVPKPADDSFFWHVQPNAGLLVRRTKLHKRLRCKLVLCPEGAWEEQQLRTLKRRGTHADKADCQQAWHRPPPKWACLPRLTPVVLPTAADFLQAAREGLCAHNAAHPDAAVSVFPGSMLRCALQIACNHVQLISVAQHGLAQATEKCHASLQCWQSLRLTVCRDSPVAQVSPLCMCRVPAAVVSIQAAWRAHSFRTALPLTQCVLRHRAALCLQRAWRSRLWTQHLRALAAAATLVQSLSVMSIVPSLCLTLLSARMLGLARQRTGNVLPCHRLRWAFHAVTGGAFPGWPDYRQDRCHSDRRLPAQRWLCVMCTHQSVRLHVGGMST